MRELDPDGRSPAHASATEPAITHPRPRRASVFGPRARATAQSADCSSQGRGHPPDPALRDPGVLALERGQLVARILKLAKGAIAGPRQLADSSGHVSCDAPLLRRLGVKPAALMDGGRQLSRLVGLGAVELLGSQGDVAAAHDHEPLSHEPLLLDRDDLERTAPVRPQPPLGVEYLRATPMPVQAGLDDDHPDALVVPRLAEYPVLALSAIRGHQDAPGPEQAVQPSSCSRSRGRDG